MLSIESPALALGIVLLAGFLASRLARLCRLPAVAGYVAIGFILGPSVTNVIPDSVNNGMVLVKDLALGMVSLVIGSELVWKKMKRLGLSIVVISIVEAAITFVLVFLALRYLLHQPFVVASLLGALATVTTPVATLAVIREYRAKGPFTSTLLGVIAVDDIWCITAVGLAVGLVLSMGTQTNVVELRYLLPALKEVGLSILMGAVLGVLMIQFLRLVKTPLENMIAFLAVVYVCAGVARYIDLSALLMTMTCGVVIANFYTQDIFQVIDHIDLPVFAIFFTLAGAGLHLDVLLANWQIAAVYIVFRVIGKVGGCYLGAVLCRCDSLIRDNLGFAMLTKAGLSLGLVMYAQQRLVGVDVGPMLLSAELAAITFFEITGPIFVRRTLFRVGEAVPHAPIQGTAKSQQPVTEVASD